MVQTLDEQSVKTEIQQCRSVLTAQEVQLERIHQARAQEQAGAHTVLDDLYRRVTEAVQASPADRETIENAMREWGKADTAAAKRVTYWRRQIRSVEDSMRLTRQDLETARGDLSLVLAGGRPEAAGDFRDLLIDTLDEQEMVRVELDAGAVDMPAKEAWEVMEDLAPGEGFELRAVLPLPPLD